MSLPFCTSERLPSKLALKVYASKNGCNFNKKHSWNCSYYPLRIVTSLSYGNLALSSYMWSCFLQGKILPWIPTTHLPLFSSFSFPSPFVFQFYFNLFQQWLLIRLFLKHFLLLIHILNIQYTLLRFLCLLWFYSLQDQYSKNMSWLLSILTCCHQLQYLEEEFDLSSVYAWGGKRGYNKLCYLIILFQKKRKTFNGSILA